MHSVLPFLSLTFLSGVCLQQYGDLRTLYTACKEQGWLMISYWNIIAAKLAKVNLDRQIIHGRRCGVQFAPNKEAKELQEGVHVSIHMDSARSLRNFEWVNAAITSSTSSVCMSTAQPFYH